MLWIERPATTFNSEPTAGVVMASLTMALMNASLIWDALHLVCNNIEYLALSECHSERSEESGYHTIFSGYAALGIIKQKHNKILGQLANKWQSSFKFLSKIDANCPLAEMRFRSI